MAWKSAFPPMIRSCIVLFFLMTAGKAPIAAGSGLPAATGREPIINVDNISQLKLIKQVYPAYPELAKRARVSGKVILILEIDEEGTVAKVSIQSGHPFLNEAAIDAVKRWKYQPILLSGEPVPAVATVTVIFNLDQKTGAASGEPRIAISVADAIMRNKAGQSIADKSFIREGKANLELTVANKTADVTSKLKSAGFEITAWPKGSQKVTGGIAIEKLELLLNIDAVQYIAPKNLKSR
jgi:TonB family protein